MPPTLNPNESREAATIRWLTTIIAALVQQSTDGELKISRNSLAVDHDSQDLVESRDRHGDIILRFDNVRHMAIYPLNGGMRWDQTKPEPASPASSPMPLPSGLQQNLFPDFGQPAAGVTSPKDQQTIRKMEETIKKQQFVNRVVAGQLKKEQDKNRSLEGLLENAEVLGERGR